MYRPEVMLELPRLNRSPESESVVKKVESHHPSTSASDLKRVVKLALLLL